MHYWLFKDHVVTLESLAMLVNDPVKVTNPIYS